MNDYAHFCLGRSLEKTGRTAEARKHAALAACMRPDRKDYQAFRERLRAALAASTTSPSRRSSARSSTAATGRSA